MQTAACSCLQTEQIQGCYCILFNSSISFFCFLSLSSAYSHKKTTGIPIAKKINIVLTGTRKTTNANPKITAPMPNVASQRFVRLSISISGSLPIWRTQPPYYRFEYHHLISNYSVSFFFLAFSLLPIFL